MPPHAHETPRFVIVLHGRYTERAGRSRSDCRPATIVYRPAGEVHSESYEYGNARYVSVALPGGYVAFDDARRQHRFASSFQLRSEAIATLGARLAAEIVASDSAAAIVIEGLTLELLARVDGFTRAHNDRAPKWMATARAMIEAQPHSVTPRAIAGELGLDASYVARAFRAHVGRTLGDSIREVRIADAARRLTSDQDASIADVALGAGFFDQSHFNRAFKRVVGVTPREFRQFEKSKTSKILGRRGGIVGACAPFHDT